MTESYEIPGSHPRLAPGAVQIWRAAIDPPPADLATLAATLADDERNRAARFYFEPDRQRYIAARGTLRRLLSRYTLVPPEDLVFRYGSRGKPEIDQPVSARTIRFNVSHRGAFALYAFALERDIGVDIEYLRDVPQALAIGRKHFTPAESRLLQQAAESGRVRECFFRLWTGKEAVIKAVGTGLSMPLDEFDVGSQPEVEGAWRVVSVPSRPETSWAVCDLRPAEDYRGALCIAGTSADVSYWNVASG